MIDGVDLGVTALTNLLAEVSDRLVILVEDNAHLVHQSNLFFIVTIELCGAGIDVGEESQNALGRDGLGLSDCSSGRHCRWEGLPFMCLGKYLTAINTSGRTVWKGWPRDQVRENERLDPCLVGSAFNSTAPLP